ncbi:MAG TPA: F0F1 ATP synthase subunit B [Candidatus Paceibacterota bacterium]|nr:F0F1 ATP synthase subunit B [Candidatus Paceibacterota bacterium]
MTELIQAFGLNWKLLLIQIFNFGLVLLVLWYFLYRPVMSMVDKRQKKIIHGMEDAEKAREQLKNAGNEKKAILAAANQEAERLVADGKHYAEERKDEIMKEAMAKSEQALKDAVSRGEEAKQQLLRESKEEIARMVVRGAEQILRTEISK